SKRFLPLHFDSLFALEPVGVEELSKMRAVFVNEPGDLHVEATVLGYFHKLLFPPPLDRVDAIAGFSDAESRLSDVLQCRLDAYRLFDLHQQIKRWQLVRKVQDRVTHQDVVVEVHNVEAHDKVGSKQLADQVVYAFLLIDAVFVEMGTIRNPEGHPHIAFLVPASYIIRSALCLQIKINNVHIGASRRAARSKDLKVALEAAPIGCGLASQIRPHRNERDYR